jgi:hypothetical protein
MYTKLIIAFFILCCSKLKSQWDEKMELLSRLEQNMADVQASFKEKEAILMKERDEAVENSR